MPQYRYLIASTGHSSARYGPCEVCREYASDVFSQTEERCYVRQPRPLDQDSEAMKDILEDPGTYQGGEKGWTQNGCHSLYGHEQCLISRRREEIIEVISHKEAARRRMRNVEVSTDEHSTAGR